MTYVDTTDYRIVKDGHGAGGFMSPPGHPSHTYSVNIYTSPRARKVIGSMSITSAATDEHVPAGVRARVRKILADAELSMSNLWVRHVYGYWRNMYVPESGSTNASDLISDSTHSLPAERHGAVAHIRKYFPDHKPRTDLIADPGKGYGSWPCTKCGERVQYDETRDALCIVTTRLSGSGITMWNYEPNCAKGGAHTVD